MNKRIRKKHMPRFNLALLGFNCVKLERVVGRKIDHKIKRSLINRRFREYRKEPKNTEMIELMDGMLEKMWIIAVEQSFHPMGYYENKSMEDSINE